MPKASPAHHNADRIRHPSYSGNPILSAISSPGGGLKDRNTTPRKTGDSLAAIPGKLVRLGIDYQSNLIPKLILRPGFPTVPFCRPPLVSAGTPKPEPSLERPASSRNGSTELKFGWLKAFNMDMGHCTLKFSFTLIVFENWMFALFVHASRTVFRPTLPNSLLY